MKKLIARLNVANLLYALENGAEGERCTALLRLLVEEENLVGLRHQATTKEQLDQAPEKDNRYAT
jgi:hypothetical protein